MGPWCPLFDLDLPRLRFLPYGFLATGSPRLTAFFDPLSPAKLPVSYPFFLSSPGPSSQEDRTLAAWSKKNWRSALSQLNTGVKDAMAIFTKWCHSSSNFAKNMKQKTIPSVSSRKAEARIQDRVARVRKYQLTQMWKKMAWWNPRGSTYARAGSAQVW